MVRRASKKDENGSTADPNPEGEERKRLKKLALTKSLVSDTPSKSHSSPLSPSKTVIKHHGKDVLKKSQRKNRFLFSFPGLLAPITGGKIGELKDLGTKNPILYLLFPQGQMKLFGTIVYPKNRYLTLQFSRGGKNVMCEDYFDNMIVFSDAWWIGRKDENPEEVQLEFPKELNEGQRVEYDFKGGAGATSEKKQGVIKAGMKDVEQESPKADLEDDLSDSGNNLKDLMEATPVRHSGRTAGKTFNFAEASSGDDSVESDTGLSEGEEKKVGVELDMPTSNHTLGNIPINWNETENSCSVVHDIDNEDAVARTHFAGQIRQSATSVTNSKEFSQSAVSVTKSKELSRNNHGSLVQATISTLFKKVEEKKVPINLRKSSSPKVSGQNLRHIGSKRKTDQAEGPRKKGKVIEERKAGGPRKKGKAIEGRKAGTENTTKKKQPENTTSVEPVKVYQRKTKSPAASAASTPVNGQASVVPASNFSVPTASSQVEDDVIEQFSSTSQDTDGSDEDWAA